jgi:hypothetical protein
MSGEAEETASLEREVDDKSILVARVGHGANCSSMGSVIDTLFASAVVGGAIFAALVAAMKRETITVVGNVPPSPPHGSNRAEKYQ